MNMKANPTSAAGWCPVEGAAVVTNAAAQPYDRRWLVVDAEGCPRTSAAADLLASISVELKFGYLVLRAPGMLRLDIPLDVIEDDDSVISNISLDGVEISVADEGSWAAEWFTQIVGKPVRLVKRCDPVS